MTQTAPPLARRLAAPALSLLALTTPALAQFDGGNGRSFDLLATTGELGACSATASGHLFGELSLDAVLLFEETPMVFKAPEVYRSRCDLSVTANDVAVWPRFELGEGPDWIFVTGPAGLSCFVWNPSTRAFEDIAPIDQSGSDWLDSPDVGIADLDGNPSLDIYGVSADRTKVMLSRFVTQVWHNYLPTSFTGPILAVEPVAWDMLPNQELAVRTPDKLYIIDLFGVELDSVDLTQPGQLMRVIDIPGAVNQAVFVFSNGAAGPHQWLDILSQSGIHQTIDFGSIEPVGIQLGDFDLEGTDDFVLSHTGSPDLPLWRAELQGGNLQFSQSFVEPHIPVLHWHSTLFNMATPAVADFDSDSDPDVLFAPVGTDRIDLRKPVRFKGRSTKLTPASLPVLNEVAKALNKMPGVGVRIEAHTDDQGGSTENLKLSQKQAETVKKYLAKRGVQAGRLAAVGQGEDSPVDENDTEEGREANRRIELHLIR